MFTYGIPTLLIFVDYCPIPKFSVEGLSFNPLTHSLNSTYRWQLYSDSIRNKNSQN